MHEHDRIGVNIVVTGLSATAGFAVGGPLGAAVGAVLPEVVREITAERVRNVEAVADHASELAGFTGPELVEWVRASDRHAEFLVTALEAAWEAFDTHKLRTLGYVLADGIRDEARLDIDQLVIRAIRELEAAHVRVLRELALQKGSTNGLRGRLPELADGMPSLIATLERTGCIALDSENPEGYYGMPPFVVTSFGQRCLAAIRAEKRMGE